MHFHEYLKLCREDHKLTQEQLVSNLYNYDIDSFSSLDTNTFSRWERNSIKPSPSKQVILIKYFQTLSLVPLPCWDKYTQNDIQKLIPQSGMNDFLGKGRKIILNFPDTMMNEDDLTVIQLRDSQRIDNIIATYADMDKSLTQRLPKVLPEHYMKWSKNELNSFFVCQYKGQPFGILFTLRLKAEIFKKIINLEMKEEDLKEEDFAAFNELGSNYTLAFFSMSKKVATKLFIHYYAHIISNQMLTDEIGIKSMRDDGRKVLTNMNFKPQKTKKLSNGLTLVSHSASIYDFLASQYTVKMMFPK